MAGQRVPETDRVPLKEVRGPLKQARGPLMQEGSSGSMPGAP